MKISERFMAIFGAKIGVGKNLLRSSLLCTRVKKSIEEQYPHFTNFFIVKNFINQTCTVQAKNSSIKHELVIKKSTLERQISREIQIPTSLKII